jgi:hypothetical protein
MLPLVLHREYLLLFNTVPTKQRLIVPLQPMPDVLIVEGLLRDQSVQQQREIFRQPRQLGCTTVFTEDIVLPSVQLLPRHSRGQVLVDCMICAEARSTIYVG